MTNDVSLSEPRAKRQCGPTLIIVMLCVVVAIFVVIGIFSGFGRGKGDKPRSDAKPVVSTLPAK